MINNLSRSFSFKEAYIYIFSFFKYFIHFEILLYAFYMYLLLISFFFPFLQTFYTIIIKLLFSINSPSNISLCNNWKKKNYQKISPNNKFKVKKSKESKLVINFWNSFLWQIIPRI